MAVTKIHPIKSTLKKALDYIENPDKTDGKLLVASFACSYETAD
ncbi:TPA: relaxase, partial [Enterococcus faecium]|nr:relaxase [Enterococcus faecium]